VEWTKIKPKHFLYSDIPLPQRGVLVTILCLTAHLERIPTEKEMIRSTQVHAYKALSKRLVDRGESLEYIVSKVLEDCEKVEVKRNISRNTSKTYRDKQKPSDVSHDAIDKIREEKRRLEKNIVVPVFEEVWQLYPLKDGKKSAERHFKATVKTEKDQSRISLALCKYLDHLKLNSWKKAKSGSTWFNNWEDWENWEEPEVNTVRKAEKKKEYTKPKEEITGRYIPPAE